MELDVSRASSVALSAPNKRNTDQANSLNKRQGGSAVREEKRPETGQEDTLRANYPESSESEQQEKRKDVHRSPEGTDWVEGRGREADLLRGAAIREPLGPLANSRYRRRR